jgi:predicted mannosyl-3-phosphoglycerate phosphatase (HAD superfamily)
VEKVYFKAELKINEMPFMSHNGHAIMQPLHLFNTFKQKKSGGKDQELLF